MCQLKLAFKYHWHLCVHLASEGIYIDAQAANSKPWLIIFWIQLIDGPGLSLLRNFVYVQFYPIERSGMSSDNLAFGNFEKNHAWYSIASLFPCVADEINFA